MSQEINFLAVPGLQTHLAFLAALSIRPEFKFWAHNSSPLKWTKFRRTYESSIEGLLIRRLIKTASSVPV